MNLMTRMAIAVALASSCGTIAGYANAQAAPERALSIPGSRDARPAWGNAQRPNLGGIESGNRPIFISEGACADLLQKEKRLTALLKTKIERLETQLAQAQGKLAAEEDKK